MAALEALGVAVTALVVLASGPIVLVYCLEYLAKKLHQRKQARKRSK